MLLKTVYTTVFFAPLLPMGVGITVFFLGFFYWSEKVIILKKGNFS